MLNKSILRYKILFLDVLFPLSLDKVIFVDAGKCSSCCEDGYILIA